jgi:hypothetical protein
MQPLPQFRREWHQPLLLPFPEHLKNQVVEIDIVVSQV